MAKPCTLYSLHGRHIFASKLGETPTDEPRVPQRTALFKEQHEENVTPSCSHLARGVDTCPTNPKSGIPLSPKGLNRIFQNRTLNSHPAHACTEHILNMITLFAHKCTNPAYNACTRTFSTTWRSHLRATQETEGDSGARPALRRRDLRDVMGSSAVRHQFLSHSAYSHETLDRCKDFKGRQQIAQFRDRVPLVPGSTAPEALRKGTLQRAPGC